MLAARVEQKNKTYLHNLQKDRRSLPRPTGVAMFGINPDRRSHDKEEVLKRSGLTYLLRLKAFHDERT